MPVFEYDRAKSQRNLDKHGIDFESAQTLWDDPHLLEIPAKTVDEPRVMAIGRIGERMWSAIYTPRNSSIRLISVRRSRPEEVEIYES